MTVALLIKYCLVGAGVSFLAMAAICMMIYPEVFRHYDYGISYFGSVPSTLIPYYVGFTLTVTFVVLVAKRLWRIDRPLSGAFWAIAIFMVCVAASSYTLSGFMYALHWVFAALLVACILVTIFWLVWRSGLSWLDYALASLVVCTVVISGLQVVHNIPIARAYIPRELLVFVCSLWLFGRTALGSIAKQTKP